ncbi:MAG TPA: DUF5686 family protein, partial [Bacteroidales bacterium]
MSFRILPLFIFLCWFHKITAQYITITGKITDVETHEALAFVNISYNSSNTGITSNIDGVFKIETSTPLEQLTFSYVGYDTKTIILQPGDNGKELDIKLTKKEVELAEIKVKPGENPAHRIIKKVLENRDRNNPEKMGSFSYSSYNKMHFTLQQDTSLQRKHPIIHLDSTGRDTSLIRLNKILSHQHLLLMEFVSQRFFKYPDKNNEKIISSRVSGFTDPSFTLLATQMQSFGFYNNMVTLLNKEYLNPISPGSTKKYFFLLEDTFITETFDTLFVISYRPKRGSNFEGLQGVLYINTNGYAIQNVIAEPYLDSQHFAIRIQQRYELIDHKQWFPTQLNTDLLFKGSKIKTKQGELYPVGIGKSYLSDIKLNPDLSKVKFSNIEVQVADNAHKQPDSTWLSYRQSPLTAKDSATYHVIDSLGKAKKFDQKLQFAEALMSGYIPYKIFNIDYRKFFGYNRFEGIRLGLGLSTNQKVASFFSLGGYFAYGLKDEDCKYGSSLQLFRDWNSETKLTIKYTRDVWENAHYSFFEDKMMNSSEWYRDFLINEMDMTEEKELSLCFRALQYFKINLYLNQSWKHIANYGFETISEGITALADDFRFTEAGVNVKFGFKEKFILTPSKRKLSIGTDYPMVWFNLKKGLNTLNGEFQYTTYELKLFKRFTTRKLGKSSFTLVTGKVDGNIPICNLYNGRGSYRPFTLEAENSFATMRLNEFYSSEFASLFLRQDFGSLLFNSPYFKPEICLVTNIGFGELLHP